MKIGYQLWKATNATAREAILCQMELNNHFLNQPMAENYTLYSEEILDTDEHYCLTESAPGYHASIWDMAKNYRKFKGEDLFELGDVLCIYHFDDERKYASTFLTIGHYFYGWDKNENHLLRDYEPVQQSWLKATKTEAY